MLSSIQCQLLQILRNSTPTDAETVFRSAAFIFEEERKLLEAAVTILEEINSVRRIVSNSSGRHFWLVSGKQGRKYVCFQNFCPCRSFKDTEYSGDSLEKGTQKVCKHLIAIILAECIQNKISLQVLPYNRN